ncbi:ATP-binding protein [Hyphomicrobium sp. CS1GBMeth3]|uniref:Lon protease family protein n=1 Tax=Hyphomicrobium sp. CS1GBMeth3 TaxID=1892845 RepID=UPI0009FA340B|nr:ATP-binding protein [Hyphomicrobium sp. CS1GBMeth3]
MFFKRLTKSKSAPHPSVETDDRPSKTGPVIEVKSGVQPLAATELRRSVDGKSLGFKTTADLEPVGGLVGQERALAAIDFGLSMRARDFNIFVVGSPSSAKSGAVRMHLAKVAAASQTPSDWIYVNNFADPRRPRAISLPPGRGPKLADGMRAVVAELVSALPAAFSSEDYRARRRAIDEEFRGGQEDALEALYARAAQQNIAVLRTPLGFGMAPMHDGKVVRSEVFSQLPEAMRRDVETRITALQTELEAILASAPKAEKRRRQQLTDLNDEVARHVVEETLDALSSAFSDVSDVASYLADVEKDLIRNAALLATEVEERAVAATVDPAEHVPRFRRYLVNVLVTSNSDKAGAPVREASNPTLHNLVGTVSYAAQAGDLVADFLSIRPGALHHANGGALMIEARRLLGMQGAWESLKRALETGEIRIAQNALQPDGIKVETLEPDPIPLVIKIVLLVDSDALLTLEHTDPDFPQLFKVQADLDDSLARSAESDRTYAGLVASIVKQHGLKAVDASGVARLMEEAQRVAEDRDKLSIDAGRIGDLMREADYWAEADNRKVTTATDIARALKERARRTDRLREQVQESVERGIVLVDTAGKKAGQINALSLVQKGQLVFGRPARITARVHIGQGRVTDIEREVALGGPVHSKGVMILWGFLAGRFAQEVPLALAATLVFEQSYDTIEGDSASAAELFALMSALADVPLRQELAVTGSVNQLGEVQAVGGVNEKIEGFFDVCAARGLTGTQGILIPEANRQNLMLREDVVAAVREGRFSVYAIKTVDEGISLLTGLDAGEKNSEGRFGADTVSGRVAARLKTFAERARAFSGAGTTTNTAGSQ